MADLGFRLGASVWGFYGRCRPEEWPTLPDAVRAILSIDSSLGVEVWGSKSLDVAEADEEELAELAEVCRTASFVTVHVRGVYMAWDPTGLRSEIDFAARVGAHSLVLHPACLGLMRPDHRLDVPEIRRMADYAAERRVRLALENSGDAIWLLDRVLEEVGDDPEATNLGICVDTGHAHMSHDAGREPVPNYLERYAGQLAHVHLHDNHGASDEHLIPGKGTIDWPRAVRTLREIGFDGTAILEVHPAGVSPTEGIRQGLAFLVSLM
jgi:sugar phosphate isomerase/epimerase